VNYVHKLQKHSPLNIAIGSCSIQTQNLKTMLVIVICVWLRQVKSTSQHLHTAASENIKISIVSPHYVVSRISSFGHCLVENPRVE